MCFYICLDTKPSVETLERCQEVLDSGGDEDSSGHSADLRHLGFLVSGERRLVPTD